MMDFVGQRRRTMNVYLFCVFWLLTVSTTIRLSEAKVEAEEDGLKIVPDYPDESHKETNETERYKLVSFNFHHVEVPYVICLWILLASIAKIGFHLYDKLPHIFPESCVLIVMGILVGVTLYYTETADATQYALDAKSFFLFLLPPIIYDAGYHMPNRLFFNNIGTILLLAVVNTLWNTFGIGLGLWGMSYLGWIHRPISILHAFVFSALISAVDPVAVLAIFEEIQVNEILYILVFGESLLNDGVTVVLYHMMEGFTEIGESNLAAIDFVTGFCSFFIVVIGGTLIGVIYGLVGAFITKYTDHVRIIEPIFIFVLGYLAYLTAESMELSGILALTFGGIIMRHYTEMNMAKKSTTTVKYFMKMMANVSETIIFMFLGLSTVIDSHEWNLDFILFTILFCIIFRVTGVMFLSFMVNRRRVIRLSAIDQFIMSYGGLRGGIAFCLALLLNARHIPEKAMFVTTTMVIVFFTVFVQGITIKPVVNALKVERAEEKEPSMNEIFHRRVLDHLMAGIEDIVGKSGHNSLHHKFEYYNGKYLKPWLLREKPKTRDTSIIRVFTKLNMADAKATAKAFPGAMSREASWSQFNMPARSASMTSLNTRRSTITVPNDQDSEIIINMHGMDPTTLKQMPDDLSLHRVLEDSMRNPRASWAQERRHTLAEIHNPYAHPHAEQEQIRHLFGNGGVYTHPAGPQPPPPPPPPSMGMNHHPEAGGMMNPAASPPRMPNGVGGGGGGRKVRKNVSFSAVHGRLGKKLSDVLEQSFGHESDHQSDEKPEDIPEVTFNLGEFSPPPPVHSPDASRAHPLAQTTTTSDHHPASSPSSPSPPLPSPPSPLSPATSSPPLSSSPPPLSPQQQQQQQQPSSSSPSDSPPAEPGHESSTTTTTSTTSQQQQQQQQSSSLSSPPPPPPSSSAAANNTGGSSSNSTNDNKNHNTTTSFNVYTALFDNNHHHTNNPNSNNEDNSNTKNSKTKHKSNKSKTKTKSKSKSASSPSSSACQPVASSSPTSTSSSSSSSSNPQNPNLPTATTTTTTTSSADIPIPHPFSQLAISSDIPLPLPLPSFTKGSADNDTSPYFHHPDNNDKFKDHNLDLDHKTPSNAVIIRCDDSGQGSSSPICDDRSDLKSDMSADIGFPLHHHHHHHHPHYQEPVVEETIAESSLPWRRQTSSLPPVPSSMSLSLPDDEHPLMSEAPSWADNLAYHHLTESGSPYHSPYNTLTGTDAASPPPAPRPVFDLFPPSSPSPDEEDHHNNVQEVCHAVVDTIPPPPWKDEDSGHIDEEPIPSQSAMTSRDGCGDKASCFLVSSHDLIPPSHHSCLEFRTHTMTEGGSTAGGGQGCSGSGGNGGSGNNNNHHNNRLHRVGSLASSPAHFQLMDKPDAISSNAIESELIGVESDYHHEMRDRVAKWLALSPPASATLGSGGCGSGTASGGGDGGMMMMLSPESEMILESLRKKKEQWEMEDTPSGTDADAEDDESDDCKTDNDDNDDDDDDDDDGIKFDDIDDVKEGDFDTKL